MAEKPQDNQTALDIESQIKSAINSRSSYFQEQADSLTFEKVRRLLEKDLGLETHALDTHKRFVKQWLQTCIESATSDNLSKSQDEAGENVVSSTDEPQPVDDLQVKNEAEEANAGGVQTMEDSPVMGLMTGPEKEKPNVDAEDTESKLVPDEITIKKSIWARASYLRENSENITLVGLRRLLEEDMAFKKHSLDPFKKFIGQEVDEILNLSDVPQSTESEKKKNPKKNSSRKVSSNSRKEETAASSGNESDEVEEEEVKVRKRSATKKKPQKTESVKKRKKTEEDTKGARRKQSKLSKSTSEGSDEEEGRNVSDNDNSDSSAEKPKKKKEVPKPPSYGKQVERLKSVIKSCGLSISPAIYKKVKQAPENKRESCLMKELEEMLAKEGLSTNPSEKEIKDVKKRKERAKELEGIDLSNIVSSGRRRSTTSFIPPPKPKIPDLSESESEESENDDDEDEEEEGDEEAENVEADEDQENGGNDSQNEASDKGDSE
ncbi:HIRA-interacting protein 3-like [Chenopodium quinoa]|uniref:HIRA-interacting protein 3-like n=1 Tax=Chenopodium quinoa TaxID=63459 RepID=UPI000B792C7C|nr:HIRA-interacting protein 3-like [Chenopodium quinoa]